MEYLIYSIEDDKDIAQIINRTLSKQGYTVETFYDGTSFFKKFEEKKPNMILLDMMLPDYSGSEILKKIRADRKNDDIEIIIISANHMLMDKVDGLDLGADDYIEKPFDLLELMSRVGVKVRRYRQSMVLEIQDVTIDLNKRECKKAGKIVELTNKEFDILVLLTQKSGNVVSREEIFEKIWNTNQILESRALDMHIKSLRNKIDPEQNIIKTIYGIGYKVLR